MSIKIIFNDEKYYGKNRVCAQYPIRPTTTKDPQDPMTSHFLFCLDPRIFFHFNEISFASYIMSSVEIKKILGSGQKRKVISESLGHKENVGVLRCSRY